MGNDGFTPPVANRYVGKDVYGFALHYFGTDYKSISSLVMPFAKVDNTVLTDFKPLYNGNIAASSQNQTSFAKPLLFNYAYDQLNRLVQMRTYKHATSNFASTNAWTPAAINDYNEDISYDGNGNILQYKRYGNSTNAQLTNALLMDSLSYKYEANSNRLDWIKDTVGISRFTVDIDNQSTDNYGYDEIGNLTRDTKDSISSIQWNVYGKISKIIKTNGTNINYSYDVAGNRLSKIVTGAASGNGESWYVRDASGNIMSVYTVNNSGVNGGALTLGEQNVYGSSRLGIRKPDLNLITYNQPLTYMNRLGFVGYYDNFTRGKKFFELTNHLGNVLVTVSDKKPGIDSGNNGIIDYYTADIVSATDYYPFGMQMPGRNLSSTNYRYGFNGKENDNEVKGAGNQQDYGMRIYDPRVGRFLSVDPLTPKYPELTPYQYSSNSPIAMIDIDGLEGGWELNSPASNLRYHFEMQQKLPPKRTPQAATSSPTPVIQLVYSEAPPLALQQAKQRAMNEGLTLTPEQRKAAEITAIDKQMWRNRATIKQGGYLGSDEYLIAKANYDTYGKYLPGLSDFDDLAGFANAVGEGRVNDASIFAAGFILPEVSGKMLKGPLHHIYTNKNFIRGQQWSKKFEPLFEKAGYKLDDAINKIEIIGHKGPHPEEYHQAIFDRLQSATKGLEGDDYKKAFDSTLEVLRKEVSTKGSELNKLLTKEK